MIDVRILSNRNLAVEDLENQFSPVSPQGGEFGNRAPEELGGRALNGMGADFG